MKQMDYRFDEGLMVANHQNLVCDWRNMWHEERLFINGELRDADGGATFDNINPATEEVIGVSADVTTGF